MTISWTPISNSSPDWLYNYLSVMEDATNGVVPVGQNGNPTIGLGFDLVTGGPVDQNAVLIWTRTCKIQITVNFSRGTEQNAETLT